MQPSEAFTKTGTLVLVMLQAKHPETCAPFTNSLNIYSDGPSALVHVYLTEDTVIEVSRCLSGGTAGVACGWNGLG